MIGISEYSSAFKKFFTMSGSTIESFRLNINFISAELSGSILEYDLLNEMPRLSSLDLLVQCDRPHIYYSTAIHHIEIEQFQTTAWQKFHPIVCWHNEICGCQKIFTLPYNDRHVRSLMCCKFSTNLMLLFSSLRYIRTSLICQAQYVYQFLFVLNAFVLFR